MRYIVARMIQIPHPLIEGALMRVPEGIYDGSGEEPQWRALAAKGDRFVIEIESSDKVVVDEGYAARLEALHGAIDLGDTLQSKRPIAALSAIGIQLEAVPDEKSLDLAKRVAQTVTARPHTKDIADNRGLRG